MRKSYQSSVSYDFTASVYDALTGKVRLQLSDALSSSMKSGRYLYDIEIATGSNKYRVLEGIVVITPEITKS